MKLFVVAILFIGSFIFSANNLCAQDSARATSHVSDSLTIAADSSTIKTKKQSEWEKLLLENKFLNLTEKAEARPEIVREWNSTDGIFYYLLGVAALLALSRKLFEKFFSNLYRIFFNLTLRQNQIREQLMQARLPNTLFDIFFMLVFGLFLYFILQKNKMATSPTDWLLLALCTIAVFLLYFIKKISLRFYGWLSGLKNEMSAYSFAVFLINKITGMVLFPVVLLLSVSQGNMRVAAVTIALAILVFSFLFRFLRGYNIFGKGSKSAPFSYFIYVLLIELLPLAVIYKFATNYFGSYL